MSSIFSVKEDLALLERSVEDAAKLVMGFFQKDPQAWKKNDVSPVSEADLASDTLLKDRLLGARPGYGWLSEETEDTSERLARECIWIVDPIDGTNAFLEGRSDFTVCAGLARNGVVLAGAVKNPVNDQLFTAIRGEGAWLNGETLAGLHIAELSEARFLCRRNVMKPERWRNGVPAQKPGYIGSLAYQLCLIAMGERDVAVSVSGLHEWDIAAAGLILTEAGGVVTDQHGIPLSFNQPTPKIDGMICAAPGLYAQISEDFVPRHPS